MVYTAMLEVYSLGPLHPGTISYRSSTRGRSRGQSAKSIMERHIQYHSQEISLSSKGRDLVVMEEKPARLPSHPIIKFVPTPLPLTGLDRLQMFTLPAISRPIHSHSLKCDISRL